MLHDFARKIEVDFPNVWLCLIASLFSIAISYKSHKWECGHCIILWWKGVLWFYHCQYVIMSVDKRVFFKAAHRLFLKLHVKLGFLKGKKLRSWIFGKKSHFGNNAPKHPQNRIFWILQKIVHWCGDFLGLNYAP